MKKTFFVLLIVVLCASCNNESTLEDIGDSSAQITIGAETYNINFEANRSCNKNCDNLFINFDNRKKGENSFGLRMYLKESGAINKIWYWGDEGIFESSYFDPYNHFKIKNFTFDNKTNSLYFEFEGNLFSTTSPKTNPLFLKGKVNIPVLKDIECQNYYPNVLMLHNENIRLLYRESGSTANNSSTPNKSYKYVFSTDNGLLFTLNSDKNLTEPSLGEYVFDTSNITNNITLKEYIGLPDVSPSFHDKNWITYKTTGSFTITGQYEKNNHKKSVGYINLKAFNNDELKYNFENIYFEVQDIE